MASKRHVRRKQCEGKIKFPDQQTAERAAASHMRAHSLWMTAYHCPHCSRYHIGHPPSRVRQAIAARRQGL